MSNTLQDYLTDVQRLLKDSSYNFWGQTELISYINKARKLVSAETACTRQLQSINVIAATNLTQATYDMSTMVAGRRVTDVFDIILQYSSNTAYQLRYLPFQDAVRTALWQYQKNGTPSHYTIHNQIVIILPWPAVLYAASQFDVSLEPVSLSATTDVDSDILFPFTECVGFYAAYLAKLKDQRRQQAEEFLSDYQRRKIEAVGTTFTRRLINR